MKNGIRSSLTYCLVLISIAYLMPFFVYASDYPPQGPDIIICEMTSLTDPTAKWQAYFYLQNIDTGNYIQGLGTSSRKYVMWDGINSDVSANDGNWSQDYTYIFNADGTWNNNYTLLYNTTSDCETKNLFDLYGLNRAFYFSGASSTLQIIDNPSQTFFNGFVIFLMFSSWIIWIFRPKSN